MKTNVLPTVVMPSALYNTGIKCPYCGSDRVIRKGKKRDQCRECKHTFPAVGVKRKKQRFPKW